LHPFIAATFFVAFAAVSSGADAEVYRCQVNGKTVYSDRPCDVSAKTVNVQPNSVGEIDQSKMAEKCKAR
jgi:hypothetical protein